MCICCVNVLSTQLCWLGFRSHRTNVRLMLNLLHIVSACTAFRRYNVLILQHCSQKLFTSLLQLYSHLFLSCMCHNAAMANAVILAEGHTVFLFFFKWDIACIFAWSSIVILLVLYWGLNTHFTRPQVNLKSDASIFSFFYTLMSSKSPLSLLNDVRQATVHFDRPCVDSLYNMCQHFVHVHSIYYLALYSLFFIPADLLIAYFFNLCLLFALSCHWKNRWC